MIPNFLGLEEILEIHSQQITRFGGSSGVRDIELLKSAISMPMAGFGDQYFHRDVFEMAAAYLYHIVLNHPFVDGNKRTGANVADVFLSMNGYELEANDHEFQSLVIGVAKGDIEKPIVADFLKKNSQKKD